MIDKRGYILSKFPGSRFNERGKIHTYCPFHEDAHPSFSITEEGMFICGAASCGARGGFTRFFQLSEGLTSWREVKERLGEISRPGMTTAVEDFFAPEKAQKSEGLTVNEFPFEPFIEPIKDVTIVTYLSEREIPQWVVDLFSIFKGKAGKFDKVDVTNGLVFPIYDIDGTYYTFQVRALGPAARRWMHPMGSCSSHLLYGGWLINDSDKYMLIVEGPSDVWRLRSLGVQAVGLFTKEASTAQLNRIVVLSREYDLVPVVCLDGDTHGVTELGGEFDYGRKIQGELSAYGLDARLVHLERDEDPGGLSAGRLADILSEVKRQDGNGKLEWKAAGFSTCRSDEDLEGHG